MAAIEAAPPELGPLATMRHALKASLGDLNPGESEQILTRMRLVLSVPALRARTMTGLLDSTDAFAPPLAHRLGRAPDDFDVRAFVSGCMTAAAVGVFAWYDAEGRADLGAPIDRAMAAPGDAHLTEYVFSRTLDGAQSGDPVEFVRKLKREDGLDIWLCGGGDLAGQLLDEVDELVIKLSPVIAGGGVPLVRRGFDPTRFTLVSATPLESGVVVLTYRR